MPAEFGQAGAEVIQDDGRRTRAFVHDRARRSAGPTRWPGAVPGVVCPGTVGSLPRFCRAWSVLVAGSTSVAREASASLR
ncbi:hypothetical protein [Kibdelosporangium philippinense]|uniref:hypothetical protein n=1 Tax=Kibdelosporangium philippinense TaxID=211113 RepID=UPI0036120D4E